MSTSVFYEVKTVQYRQYRLRLPGQSTWSRGTCKQVTPRSYHVESDGNIYRRNRRDFKKTKQDSLLEMTALRNNEQTTVSYSTPRRYSRISEPPERLIDYA